MQLAPGTTAWSPASPWIALPAGVAVDSNTANSSFLAAQPTLNTALGTQTYRGGSATYTYQVFLPKGRMSTSGLATANAPTLHLVRSKEPVHKNYYDISLNLYTGMRKVDLP